jgi:hypothetical protein
MGRLKRYARWRMASARLQRRGVTCSTTCALWGVCRRVGERGEHHYLLKPVVSAVKGYMCPFLQPGVADQERTNKCPCTSKARGAARAKHVHQLFSCEHFPLAYVKPGIHLSLLFLKAYSIPECKHGIKTRSLRSQSLPTLVVLAEGTELGLMSRSWGDTTHCARTPLMRSLRLCEVAAHWVSAKSSRHKFKRKRSLQIPKTPTEHHKARELDADFSKER